MRRIMQDQGAEVIHLGHNRSVLELVTAALQEGVQAVAISSYQGGHMEYFTYMRQALDSLGAPYVRIFGGGGGVITWAEKKELEAKGISKIFHPDEGRELGLEGMIKLVMKECEFDIAQASLSDVSKADGQAFAALGPDARQQAARESVLIRAACPSAPLTSGNVASSGDFASLPHRDLGLLVHLIEQGQHESSQLKKTSLAVERGLSRVDTHQRPRGYPAPHSGSGRAHLIRPLMGVDSTQAPLCSPVLGVTGTGGSGKSSLTDELIGRVLHLFPQARIAVFCTDPTKKKTGGALLGDRIRMNFLDPRRVYMRSLAARQSGSELSAALPQIVREFKKLNFDLLIVESSGIGQSSSQILELADLSLYVMTAEFGAQSQLEKIDMIDFANLIAINKADRQGSHDAYHDVKKQYQRSRKSWGQTPADVFLTQSSNFNDEGVNNLFFRLCEQLDELSQPPPTSQADLHRRPKQVSVGQGDTSSMWQLSDTQKQQLQGRKSQSIVPQERQNYLAQVLRCVHQYHKHTEQTAQKLSQAQALEKTQNLLKSDAPATSELASSGPASNEPASSASAQAASNPARDSLDKLRAMKHNILSSIDERDQKLLATYEQLQQRYQGNELSYSVRGREVKQKLISQSLSGLNIKRISLPKLEDAGDRYRYLALENVPGEFPFTAGVYPLKRTNEDATRMFAGLGTPEQTNKRFHFLSKDHAAKRLSTAFDSVTLYGEDPDQRPDIYGKIGESGVSIATLDDMKRLYKGFNLCDPSTSVSMTINGPAPLILAFFLNTAIDAELEKQTSPCTQAEIENIRAHTLQTVRGTLQADILKEDQGQNTCIFSTDFALKLMGDVQEYFIQQGVRNFYSVSISGYHIAEAGANPITQLAFTLSNAFTFVEYYLHRGFDVDEFAPNLSFFFSNGLDPEYTVMGRVARRIWAIVMRDFYKANPRSQKLKYHIQTSGRSLHAQEMSFNDIRTTLQALLAVSDHCNSLHTNAFDEALTTPTQASVRQAQAIQMILQKEFGFNKNENPLQGSYFCQQLTDAVEQAVLDEMMRLNERGGVLGAMERQYQRSRIQDESMHYEHLKHSGEFPIVGVNTFLNPDSTTSAPAELERCPDEDKTLCLQRCHEFRQKNAEASASALEALKQVALRGDNIFSELMSCARVCSLGQMSKALYEVGGRYRRNL